MRDWLRGEQPFTPRPFLFVDDRAPDALEFCRLMAAREQKPGELLSLCTVVLLDAPGPDAQYAAVRMLLEYPDVQVISGPFNPPFASELSDRVKQLRNSARAGDDIDDLLRRAKPEDAVTALDRFRDFPGEVVRQPTAFAQLLDDALRPGGAIVCDIELDTLAFCKDDEKNPQAVYAALKEAHDVCGRQDAADGNNNIPAQEKAKLIVISAHNYPMGLHRRLGELGVTDITAEDCLEKGKEWTYLVNRLVKRARERFPYRLKMRPPRERVITHRIGLKDEPLLSQALDLVFWPERDGSHKITGATVVGARSADESSGRARVLRILMERHLEKSPRGLQRDEIVQEIEAAHENLDPAQLILGIKRSLNEDDRDRIVPHANCGYRLGAEARIGLVDESFT